MLAPTILHTPRNERDLHTCRDYISAISHTLCTQAFLGQKYGYRPFPPKIAANEFEAIRRELATVDGAWSLLDTWFRKDTNSVPNVYVLQPISSVLLHYTDMVCFLHVLYFCSLNTLILNDVRSQKQCLQPTP